MAINPDIRHQAYQFFLAEAPDLLQIIETGLLSIRQERNKGKVHELMRAAHSIKGGAASVELEEIASLAHRLETIFNGLYSETVEIDIPLENQLLQAFDCLALPLKSQITTGKFDPEKALAIAEPIFQQIEEKLGDALKETESYIPSSAELGINMTLSIFEVDVEEGLSRLATVLANPENYEVAGELRAQAEVFAGFGELLNLPGFSAIAETTLAKLSGYPHRVLEILPLALADFQAARQAVLSGDYTTGGNPSEPLISFPNSQVNSLTISPNLSRDILTQDATQSVTLLSDIFGENINLDNQSEAVTLLSDIFSDQTPQDFPDESLTLLDDILSNNTNQDFPPETVTLLSDIFSDNTNPDNQPEAVTLLSDIFSDNTNPDNQPEAVTLLSDIFSDNTNLDNQPETVSLLSDIFSDNTNPDNQPEAVTLLSDIFSDNTNLDLKGELTQTNPENPPTKNPITLDHKAEIIEGEFVNNQTAITEEVTQKIPTLSENFGQTTQRETSTTTAEPATLAAAVSSIEQIFDTLPTLVDEFDKSPNYQPLNISNKLKSEELVLAQPIVPENREELNIVSDLNTQTSSPTTANLAVRVDLDRLERINNLVGELAINRNSLSLENQQLQGGVRELLNRFERFGSLVNLLQDLSDQILVSASSSGLINSHFPPDINRPSSFTTTSDNGLRTNENAHFDALEMDRYGVVHSRIQSILEEMVQLEEAVDDIALFAKKSDQTLAQQRQRLNHLRDELIWARMLPIKEVLQRFPRILRELATTYNKPVNLKIIGAGVLVDKAVLEKLYDPLLHLLRNAFDHGIESPEIRQEIGKPPSGQIEIRAYHKGSQTLIEVRDDGAGLNREKIEKIGVELGLISQEELATTPTARLWELIFEPGFSTADKVSELSGRGVGLDVVRWQLQSLKGRLSVASVSGVGTTFTLRLPLTLTIAKLLVCLVGSTALALPSDSIEEIIIPQTSQVKLSGNQRFFSWRSQLVPTYKLADLLAYNCPLPDPASSQALVAVPGPENWALPLLIIKQDSQAFALEIERLVTEEELAIKPFGQAISPPNYAYGCTILGDGSLMPVIDGLALIEFVHNQMTTASPVSTGLERPSEGIIRELASSITRKTAPNPTILIVDDSVALRQTLALTLEKSGFRVLQARDGREAMERLQESSGIKLVICDIEMPNMNGFEFLSQRRASPLLRQIPIVMLTSRSSHKHRLLARQLGASAYLTKPYLEQEFLTTIKDLISSY